MQIDFLHCCLNVFFYLHFNLLIYLRTLEDNITLLLSYYAFQMLDIFTDVSNIFHIHISNFFVKFWTKTKLFFWSYINFEIYVTRKHCIVRYTAEIIRTCLYSTHTHTGPICATGMNTYLYWHFAHYNKNKNQISKYALFPA